MISYKDLSFYYGKKNILNKINLQIPEQKIIGLVGNNGVGKTTLLNILVGNIKVKNIKKLDSSYFIDGPKFYPNLTGYDNLKYFCIINSIDYTRINNVLSFLLINQYKDIKYSKYSLGTKQKLAIAYTLLFDKNIYIYDEPINGLDPSSILNFRKLIKKLKEEGKTVIISSHIISELDKCCDIIWHLDNGKINEYADNIDYNKIFGDEINV